MLKEVQEVQKMPLKVREDWAMDYNNTQSVNNHFRLPVRDACYVKENGGGRGLRTFMAVTALRHPCVRRQLEGFPNHDGVQRVSVACAFRHGRRA
jgi:hypothetical protein